MIETIFEGLKNLLWVAGPAFLVLGFLIFVHELGHFLACRIVGIRVEVFSIGFGKRLFGFRRGATDYRVSIIPFGGYVRMAGEELPGQSEGAEDQAEVENISAQYAQPGDTLDEKPVPHRLLVAFAGAGMNAIVAVLLTVGLAYFGINIEAYLVQAPVIAHVLNESPAQEAGLLTGDKILSIGDQTVTTWEEAQQAIIFNIDKSVEVMVDRSGSQFATKLLVDQDQAIQFGGIGTPSRVFVGKVNSNSPAENAGLLPGDQIAKINGIQLTSVYQLMDTLSQTGEQSVQLQLDRNGEIVDVSMTPEFNSEFERYMIGIGFAQDPDQVLRRYPLKESIVKGLELNIQMSRLMVTIFKRLVTGKESLKNLGGPIMIVDMAGQAAKSGLRDLIWLTALISLNLAILNLLPLPVFDGGLIVFLLIEAIIRRPISEKIQIVLQNVVFILLISFALYISFVDIGRIEWANWFK